VVEEGALAPVTKPRLVAICADVRDPGNAGTVIRTADAAGADGVVLAGSSVDAYNPKTVRASAGSLFHLPVAVEPDVALAVRTAQAAGLTVLAGSSVDAYNAKTVRASVGSLFHLPVVVEPDIEAAVAAARAAGLTVLAADGAGEVVLDRGAERLLAGRTAWLFGNEAWGLRPETSALADHRVRIPIHGRAESLNLSTAAALCLYASAAAQRGAGPDSQ